jgi:hypothetical protein
MPPLGIPTIRDRGVLMAVNMPIEPLWEAEVANAYDTYRNFLLLLALMRRT